MADAVGTRRSGLLALGIVFVVVGLVAAVGLWIAAAARLDDGVRGLARASVGCDTTLDFGETGEFLLFVETRGEIDGVRGDCDVDGAYEYAGDEPPTATLTLFDPDGGQVDLPRRDGVEYDAAGFVGRSEWVADIITTGDHVLRVESSDRNFAVAVGKDPNDGVGLLRIGAVLAGLVGLSAGIAFIVVGARRRSAAPAVPGGWVPAAGWPQSPPGTAPPTMPPPGMAPPTAWDGAPPPPGGPAPSWPNRPPSAPAGPPAGWGGQPGAPAGPPAGWGGQPGAPAGPPAGGGGQPGAPAAPGGPPPGWGGQPADPAGSPPAAPGEVPGQPPAWPGAPEPMRPTGAARRPGDRPPGAAGAGEGATGATGDGERSPWAPPHDD